MRTNIKRLIAVLLCLVMCLGMLPATALAAPVAEPAALVPLAEGDAAPSQTPIYEDTNYSFAERAADLVARMSLQQKGSQLVEGAAAIPASALGGGALNTTPTKGLARYSWWSEALHGYLRDNMNPQSEGTKDNVSYAQNLTVGSTWNPELYYEAATKISDEIRERAIRNNLGNSLNLNFYSPTVNMQRDPRWGRNEESYSEDPLLVATMGTQFVLGMEGKDQDGNMLDPNGYYKTLTTIKHYVANNTENIRTTGGATTDLRALREYYCAPYRDVIQASDVRSVMTAYSSLNGEPCSYSSYLMDTLLRQTYGFSGYITSDCDSARTIANLNYINPRTGAKLTAVEQMAGALAHGEDLECNSGITANVGDYNALATSMVESGVETDKGTFTENTIDIAVHRLMTARISTGELDEDVQYMIDANQRMADQKAAGGNNYSPDRIAVVDQQVDEGVVMLKNDGLLPLDIPATGEYKVAIVGAWQTDMYLGLYSSEQRHAEDEVHRINIQEGLVAAIKEKNPNTTFTNITSNTISAANETAIREADVAIVVTGTNSGYSAEGRDRSSIVLPNNQATLISNVGKLNENTIAIMETCGPMQVTKFENDVKAILWSSYGGIRKGMGFGRIITGVVNPSGHLTSTWHQNDSDIPDIRNYNMYNTNGDSGRTYMYYNGDVEPSYVFGYGLSYTSFEYSNLKIDKSSYDANETVKVSFDVKNTGKVDGKEVTQVYIAQPEAPEELLRPIRQLKAFKKIDLKAGETKTVELEVKIPDLAFYNEEADAFAVDKGLYQVQVGEDSAHANLTANFTVTGEMDEYPTVLTVKANQDGDDVLGIEERLIFDKGATINPQLTVAMNNEKLYGYIIKEQTSIVKSLESCPLPEGMSFTYASNRPSVVKVEGDKITAVGPGVATITVTGELDGHVVETEFVAYVETSANIDGIKIDGELMSDFSRECYTYELSGYTKAPKVEAVSNNEDLTITVTQAAGVPGTAVIRCEYAAANQVIYYRVGFGKAPVSTDFSEGWAKAQEKGWSVLNGNNKAAFGANGLTITAEQGAFGSANKPANVYMEPATGEWVAQTHLTLEDLSASGQQAGILVYDDEDNNISMVYQQTSATAGALRVYNRVAGESAQAASVNVSAAEGLYLQAVKQGADYTFNYSVDGKSWSNLVTKVNNLMACPQVGVMAVAANANAAGFKANFDGITISKVSLLYPRLSGITIDGAPLTGFDKETFFYSYEMPADATKAPVVGGIAADEDLTVECKQLEGSPFGTASITVSTDIASQTYVIAFNHGPLSDYFADGDMSDVWTVLRENKSAYEVVPGEGLVLPTQRYDIYSTGAAWENCFVAPAVGNWRVVAKVHYPQMPNANYQQAMLLVWQDEDNYIRMNCQQSSLKLEPGVETGGSFSASLNSANAKANADGTVTLYFQIERNGNNYTVSYSQDGLNYTSLGTATNIKYTDPKIGLFASMNNSGNQIKANYEYLAVTSIGGVEEMNNVQMLEWAAQNVADYVAEAIPAETSDNLSFAKIPHGYSMKVESSDPTVITTEGVVLPSGSDKNVTLTITVSEGDISASTTKTVKVPGTGSGCDHAYDAVVTEPTCTENGFTTNTCSKCGEKVITGEVPALGHDWDEGLVTKEPTASSDGEMTYTCGRCEETRTETIPATGKVNMTSIDFTKAASANRFEVLNQESSAIVEGAGITLTTTTDAFEPCNGQIETFEPADVIKVPVKGDWTATLTFDANLSGAANGYYQFFGMYAAEGDDYQNLAGIRGGDGALQNFLRVDGEITADTEGVNSTPGLAADGTYYYQIIKEGTTYTCLRSEDGETFTEMFKYADTGIAANSIVIDAYTGMTEGYAFTLKTLDLIQPSSGIDFTNPADAEKFEILEKTTAAIEEGKGLTLTTTMEAFEPCNGQIETFAPKDVVKVPISGDWTATLSFDADLSGAANGYYQFFGMYAAEGDDYQNLAGIRGGDGALQNFLRVDGEITADTEGVNSTPGLAENGSYYYQIVKEGTTYTCLRSADGETFTEMFKYADTGIEADSILIDAYTGMTEGYAFTLKSLSFDGDGGEVTPPVCEHDYKAVVTAPTCTEAGYTTYTCSKCSDTYTGDEVAALGHDYGEWTVTTAASCTEKGVETRECARCDAKETRDVAALGHKYENGVCTVCGEKDPAVHDCPSKDFIDVPAVDDWAHAGIDYCVEEGLMNGTSATLFSPANSLTRAQIATILYRIAGEPEVEYKAVFSDVADEIWYTDAIIWAAEEEIVNGYPGGTFAPNKAISREQIATILYRYAGSPKAEEDLKDYPDADSVSDWAKDAMAWAVEKGLINGIKSGEISNLAPQKNATRAQFATIIMRFQALKADLPELGDSPEVTVYPVSVNKALYTEFAGGAEGYFAEGFQTGFGSGITFKGYDADGNYQFYGITDRGPSLDLTDKDGNEVENTKVFPSPDFTPSIGIITLKDGKAVIEESIQLKNTDGSLLKGLPLPAGELGSTGEIAFDIYGEELTYDPNGFDPEGIAVDKDGNFWLADEYGPYIGKFSPDGTLIKMYKPGDGLPEILKYRIANRGFEGLSISPSGKIFATVQSVLDVDGKTAKTASFIRIVELDPETGASKMYAYPVAVSEYSSPKNCKIGDVFAVDDETLLMVEQGKLADKSMRNIIYKVSLKDATDISDLSYNGKELEYTASAEELSSVMSYAEKEVFVDLRTLNWTAEKAEGLCLTDDGALVAIIEDDFGLAGAEELADQEAYHLIPYTGDDSAQVWMIR